MEIWVTLEKVSINRLEIVENKEIYHFYEKQIGMFIIDVLNSYLLLKMPHTAWLLLLLDSIQKYPSNKGLQLM